MTDANEESKPDERHGRTEEDHSSSKPREKPEPIDLEPADPPVSDHDESDRAPSSEVPAEGSTAESKGVPLEERFTCPNCSAIMPDEDALVCLRCGFDLKTLNLKTTRIEQAAADDEEDDSEEEEVGTETPICRPGRGDLWLPAVIGGFGAMLLIVGHLAGAPALYPMLRAADPAQLPAGMFDRLIGIVQFIITFTLIGGCAMGGLWMLATALRRPIGDWALAAVRIVAIVAVIRLVRFINFGEHHQIERLVEWAMQGALFIALSIVAFTIKPRTAMMFGGFTLMALIAVWISARLIVLATW